jgi:carbon-monoxide dehydrogenase medium subunit
MPPANFDYHRPKSVAEAVSMLASVEGAKALAGGHSLLPAMNLRLAQPDTIVDVGRLTELKGIRVSGGALHIGALTTHAQIAASADVKSHAPALASAASKIGDPMVRNRGTLGGNVAHADPASDPPTVLVAYDAIIHIQGVDGARSAAAADFFIDALTTDLNPGDLVTRIEIPSHASHKSAYVKMAHPASRYALVGVCVCIEHEHGICKGASVAVGGVTGKPMRSAEAESALVGTDLDDAALNAAASALMDSIRADAIGDMFADEKYRVAMAGVYLKRAVRAALG